MAWSNARATFCNAGHRHSSVLEGRVCNRLTLECEHTPGWTLFQQPRFPLLAIAPKPNGKAEVFTPDFAIWAGGKLHRVIEAKGRVSRDYPLRARAFEASFGVSVEIISK